MNSPISLTCLLGAAALAILSACETDNGVQVNPAPDSFALTSLSAKRLARATAIPRRAPSTTFGAVTALPALLFERPSDTAVQADLQAMSPRLLGATAKDAKVADNGSTYALMLEGGAAWVAKQTGAFSLRKKDAVRGPTVIPNATAAVDKALAQINENGLLSLSTKETLDVLSVTSTHYAAWAEDSQGEMVPIYFETDPKLKSVSEYKSEYTVTFGRRYRNVPVVGSMATATLDANGQLVAFAKQWRKITGEGSQVPLLTDKEMRASIDQKLLAGREIDRVTCGYLESPAVGTLQTEPGLGCRYVLSNGSEEVDGELPALINADAKGALPLEGKPLDFTKNAPVLQGKDAD